MDNSLKNWIASSLLNGHKAEQLRIVLEKSGFLTEEIDKELEISAPYISVIEQIRRKLSLREGLIKSLDQQMRSGESYLKVERTELPPFKQFLEEYFCPNRPGLFSSVLDNSRARHWTPRNLVEIVGEDTMIHIQHKRNEAIHYEWSTNKLATHMRFGDYIDLVENPYSGNAFYMAGDSYSFNREPFALLRKELENIGDGYLLPDDAEDHKVHFLIGPQGAMTPAHYDNVNVFFIQIYGKKLIRLIPSLQVPYMYNIRYSRFSNVDLTDPKLDLYPDFAHTTPITLEVGPGDAVFIPIGWWHHVTCLTPSISASCCNLNAGNDFQIYL